MVRHTNRAVTELSTLVLVSPMVMASRLSGFWMTAAAPTPGSKREASTMITEKLQAIGESAVAVNLALTQLAIDNTIAAMTGIARATHNDVDDVLFAALKPYSNRVTANRDRLS